MTYQDAVYTLGTIKWVQVSDSRVAKERESIAMAIEALEKQIPKKPTGNKMNCCPSCKALVGIHTDVINAKYNYCPKCGQALDWGDE